MNRQVARKSGGIMVLAVVAVAVATTVALFVAAWLRQVTALYAAGREARIGAAECAAAVRAFARDVVFCDTNGVDSAMEPWRNPEPGERFANVVFEAEFPGVAGPAGGCVHDEESRFPLNTGEPGALAQLVEALSGLPPEASRRLAGEIVSMRPIARREQIRHAPSMSPATYDALAPFVTAAPTAGINLNTASDQVLRAVFSFAEKYDSSAARTLAAKISSFRANGGVFRSAAPASVDAALGGLAQGEMLLAAAGAGKFLVESRFFSGAVTCGRTAMVFTVDRETRSLVREAAR